MRARFVTCTRQARRPLAITSIRSLPPADFASERIAARGSHSLLSSSCNLVSRSSRCGIGRSGGSTDSTMLRRFPQLCLNVRFALLELDWAAVAERRVKTCRIVPGLDVLVNCCACLFARFPFRSVNKFRLDCRVETLDDGVVPAVSTTAHATYHSVVAKQLLKALAGVLTAAI